MNKIIGWSMFATPWVVMLIMFFRFAGWQATTIGIIVLVITIVWLFIAQNLING